MPCRHGKFNSRCFGKFNLHAVPRLHLQCSWRCCLLSLWLPFYVSCWGRCQCPFLQPHPHPLNYAVPHGHPQPDTDEDTDPITQPHAFHLGHPNRDSHPNHLKLNHGHHYCN